MRAPRTLEEANEVSAVRLTDKRRFAKVGDFFRLSPHPGVILWGRLIKRGEFFGTDFQSNLVYIYDAVSEERPPSELLRPNNLIIGPCVVNNLGWVRGYWEIMASEPLASHDVLSKHLFVQYRGTGSPDDYDILDERGKIVPGVRIDPNSLSQSGFGNFNYVDWVIRQILASRGLVPPL